MNATIEQAHNTNNSLLRADIYRLLSLCLDFPKEENLLTIKEILEVALESELTDVRMKPLLESLNSFVSLDYLSGLEGEYFRIFTSGSDCPESEGSYYPVDRGSVLGDVCAFYDAFGLKTISKQGTPDSMKMELAFMSYMALKEAYTIENSETENFEIVMDAQKKFLQDHLGRWGFIFSFKLQESTFTEYYKTIAMLLEFFLDLQIKHFGVNPHRVDGYMNPKEDNDSDDSQFDCALGALQNPAGEA
jgi:putative dimethyl sulfoxide reductase chaperone